MASFSNNDVDMQKQAQHIWTMLDELADSDPQAYQKFIEKNMKESKETMVPAQPYMCVKTKILRPQTCELYINMCSWTRVPKPNTEEDPIAVTGGPLEEVKDGAESYKIVRLALNPYVLDECCKHREEKAMMIQLGFKYLEHQHNIGISRNYKILDDKYKGDPSVLLKNFFLKKDDQERKNVDDFLGNITNMSPDSLLSQLGKMSVDEDKDSAINSNGQHYPQGHHPEISISGHRKSKPGLIEEIASSSTKLEVPKYDLCVKEAEGTKPRRLVVKVSLPQVTSVQDCELDITEDSLSLSAADLYELNILLPETIDESNASAKFSSKTSVLTISLPIFDK